MFIKNIFGLVIFVQFLRGGCRLATDHGNRTPALINVAKVVYLRCGRLRICLHKTYHVSHMSKSYHAPKIYEVYDRVDL